MKILFLTLEYPPQKGGVASYYAGVVVELEKTGHEVRVIADTPTTPDPSSGRRGKNQLLSKWLWPRWLRAYRIARRALKKEKFDLLFVGQVLPLGTVAYLLRKQVPYVVFTHGMDVLMAQKSRRKRWLLKKIFANAKLVVTNSEFTKNLIQNFGVQAKAWPASRLDSNPRIVVVYPCPAQMPVPSTEEVEALRNRLGLVGKKVMLTLGRVVERKGQDVVLKALPEILRHVPEAMYVVAGDGPDLERLQKMIASPPPESSPISTPLSGVKGEEVKQISPPLVEGVRGGGLQPYVRFVGAIPDEERSAYFALCDLFVMPSRQIGPIRARGRLWRPTSNGIKPDVEGFGLVFLEAAMFGKPSIGGRSGGQGEAILDGKTGALVDPNDSHALARIVVQLLRDDALRHELGQNAKARAVHEFRWEKQVEKLREILD